MNNCKKLGLMACLLAVTGLAACGCAYAAENNSIPAVKAPEPPAFEMVYGRAVGKVIVGIDLNHEVLYTILQLTDYAEKLRNGELKPIAAAVLNDLKQYKKHPAVIELEAGGRLNWANRFSFGYVTHFPQHFTSLPEGKRIYEYSDDFLERVLHGMPKDEKIKYLDAYWEKVKDFYKTAEYEEFFKRNSALYKSDVDSVYAHLPRFDFAKLHEDYHGNHDVGNFYLVPSQLNLPPGGSYGGPMSRSVFNYMGHGFDNSETIKFLILHEFGHSFCNPVVEKYLAEVGKYASLMKGLQAEMTEQKYGNWEGVMAELLVRAVHARLLLKTEGKGAAELFLLDEKVRNKFVFIKDFYDLLEVYENNRGKYPTLREFYPQLISVFSKWEVSEVLEPVETGIWTIPVSEGLRIDWAEPKKYGYAAGFREGDAVTEVDGKKPADSFFLSLENGKTYVISITRKDGRKETITLATQSRKILRPVRKPE